MEGSLFAHGEAKKAAWELGTDSAGKKNVVLQSVLVNSY